MNISSDFLFRNHRIFFETAAAEKNIRLTGLVAENFFVSKPIVLKNRLLGLAV